MISRYAMSLHFISSIAWNDRYCVHSNETVSFKTGNCYSTLYLNHNNGSAKEFSREWFHNHVNRGDTVTPSEKDISEVQFINIFENSRQTIPMAKEATSNCKYWRIKLSITALEEFLLNYGGAQYFFFCFKRKQLRLITVSLIMI